MKYVRSMIFCLVSNMKRHWITLSSSGRAGGFVRKRVPALMCKSPELASLVWKYHVLPFSHVVTSQCIVGSWGTWLNVSQPRNGASPFFFTCFYRRWVLSHALRVFHILNQIQAFSIFHLSSVVATGSKVIFSAGTEIGWKIEFRPIRPTFWSLCNALRCIVAKCLKCSYYV